MNGLTLRDEAREQLRHYTSRTGLSLGEMATRMGYARQSLLQFNSRSKYGTSDGGEIAKRILDYIQTNPPEIPIEVQGTLYETQNTVIIDHLISEVKDGRWALLYGPPGTQKTQTFK